MKIGQIFSKDMDKSIVSPFFDSRCRCTATIGKS